MSLEENEAIDKTFEQAIEKRAQAAQFFISSHTINDEVELSN